MDNQNNRNVTLSSVSLHNDKMMQIYYSELYKIVSIVSATTILFFGLLGNLSVSIIITFAKNMRTSTNCYLVSVAVADIMVLLSTIIPFISNINQVIEHWVLPYSACPLMIFIQYLSANSSALTIASFSFERWVAICYPMKAHTMCTISRTVKIVVGIWIFNLIYNSSWIYLSGIIEIPISNDTFKPVCTFTMERRHYRTIYMIDFMLFYTIPLLLTTLLYCDIIRTIVKRPVRSTTTTYREQRKALNHSKMQVVKMLMVVVILFTVLWLPYRAWIVYNSFASQTYLDLWYILFAKIMIFINSAVNPILYNALSGRFRKAFKKFFLCQS